MAYTRQPNSVLAGRALSQTPGPAPTIPAGVLPVVVDVDIATTASLGVVQVGSGLSITPAGVLSVVGGGGGSNFVNVTLTGVDYTATASDSYIGATTNNITITLPAGLLGRVYYVKNQSNGNIRVQGTGGETIDASTFKTLGSDSGFMLVFDGSRWNIL